MTEVLWPRIRDKRQQSGHNLAGHLAHWSQLHAR